MGQSPQDKPAASCAGCLAWGVFSGRFCCACQSFNRNHETAACAACHRLVAVKKRYCRLCRAQPALHGNRQITELEPFLRAIGHQQLFLAGLQRPRPRRAGADQQRRQGRAPRPEPVTPTSNAGWTQGRLFDAPRDYSRFNRRRHAVLTNPILARSRQAAATIGEARGWTRRVCNDVDRALVILLSRFVDGDKVRFSELFPALRRYRLTVERTVEVLDHLDLFDDDRTPTFDYWLERKLADLDAGIRADVEPWLRTLHDGGPRSRPRSPDTVWGYLNDIHPVLSDWSHRYHRLREVTHADVGAVSDALHGNKRHHTISVLRSLFRHCKKNNTIFRDPATGVRVGQQPQGVILPLRPTEIAGALAAATTPAARLAIALAGVHAARPKAIRELLLDDVDLGNRRLIVTGRTRPLDDLTRHAVLDWLDHRRTRWPNTANPHLIINQQTAMESGPISSVSITQALRGQAATLDRLRVDRQLDEALARGPDPLHLAAVFGLDDKTAIRYADAARHLLDSAAEHYAATSSPRTQGSKPQPAPHEPVGSH